MTTDHARAAAIDHAEEIINEYEANFPHASLKAIIARHIDAATEGLRQRAESAEADAQQLAALQAGRTPHDDTPPQ